MLSKQSGVCVCGGGVGMRKVNMSSYRARAYVYYEPNVKK